MVLGFSFFKSLKYRRKFSDEEMRGETWGVSRNFVREGVLNFFVWKGIFRGEGDLGFFS